MTAREGDGRVAYLVSQHPAPSQAFIQREIAGLRARGMDVVTFSVRAVPDELLLDSAMREEAAATTGIQTEPREVLGAVLGMARSRPRALASALRRASSTGERTLRGRVWQNFYLAEAVFLHEQMVRRGLRHLHVHFANNAADIARLVVAIGRSVDGPGSQWRWSFTMHGPTEFEAVEHFDLGAKVVAADGVACISDFARSQLMRLVPPHVWPDLSIVHMSVDTEQYRPPVSPRSRQGRLRLLSVGRLVAEKGTPLLIDAVAELVHRGVDVELKLVGGGDLEAFLRQRVHGAGLTDRVQFTGPVGQDLLPGIYHWADVFCLPSFQEGLPVVLMEAMATELPVVTTSVAGIPELVKDGITGSLVPPGRSDLMADAVQALLQRRDSAREVAVSGRLLVEREYSLNVVAEHQFRFLKSVRAPG